MKHTCGKHNRQNNANERTKEKTEENEMGRKYRGRQTAVKTVANREGVGKQGEEIKTNRRRRRGK